MYGFIFDHDGKLVQFRASPFVEDFLKHYRLAMCHGQYYKYSFKEGIWQQVDDNVVSRLLCAFFEQSAPGLWTGRYEERCKKVLAVKVRRVDEFDTSTDLLCLQNCNFNIVTGRRSKFSQELLQTVKLPITYNFKAKCPQFQAFLKQITEGDQALADTLVELLGYCLTNDVKAEKIFVLYGNGGNGKSVFIKILQNLVGAENVSSIAVSDLENNSFSRVGLLGKKVNLQSDARGLKRGVFVTEMTKAISSGDLIDAEYKYGDRFSFTPFCKLVFATNQYPEFGEDFSMGSQRRLLILPFNATFLGEKQNKNLSEELLEELPGIFNLAIDGLRRLERQDYHFTYEDKCHAFIDRVLMNQNPVQWFVTERLRYCNGNKVSYSRLHECFKQWLIQNEVAYGIDEGSLSKKLAESAVMLNSSITMYKSNGKRGIKNIKIKGE